MFNLRHLTSSSTVRTVTPGLTTSFSNDEIELLADLGSLTNVPSGSEIMHEGSDGTHAYLITAGSAAVHRGDEWVASLSRGDMVGERSLMTSEPRNATVTARMPVTALRFDREQFARLRSASPKLRGLSDELVASRS